MRRNSGNHSIQRFQKFGILSKWPKVIKAHHLKKNDRLVDALFPPLNSKHVYDTTNVTQFWVISSCSSILSLLILVWLAVYKQREASSTRTLFMDFSVNRFTISCSLSTREEEKLTDLGRLPWPQGYLSVR